MDALARTIAQIGWVHLNRGTPHEGITLLRSAVGDLGARGASDQELAGVYLALVHLCMHTGHHSEQLAATERALDLAQRSGVEHLRRQAEQLRDFAHMPDRKDELEAVLERAARVEEAGDLESVVADLMINARVAETAGASVLATRCATRAREIAERLGKQDLLAMCIAQRGGLAMTAGQWKSARADFEQACALAPQTSGYHLAPFVWMYYGYLCLLEGEIAKGASLLEEVVSLTERTGNFPALNFAQYALAEWDLMEKRPEVARQRLERLVEIEAQYLGPAMVSAMCAWALLDLGEVAEAEALIGRVVEAPRTDLFMQNTALRIQAMVFTCQRRWHEAHESIETAIAIARSLQYPFSEARGLYVCGLLYQAKGEPDLANEQFEQALAILRAMGERLYASRIERTLAEREARDEAV